MNAAEQAEHGGSIETSIARPILLFPKEHGAYGQLIFPSLTALLLGSGHQGAILALAFALAFLLHEPALVLLGHRGPRARQDLKATARRQCLLLSGLLLAVLTWTLPMLRPEARWALLLPSTLAAVMTGFILAGKERTTAGELTAAAGLSSCCVPIAVANGVAFPMAGVCWLIWAFTLMSATLSVRGVIVRAKHGQRGLARLGVVVGVSGAILSGAVAWRVRLPGALTFALAPAILLPGALWVLAPSPKHLRGIGWSFMTASLLMVILLAAILR